MLLFMTARAKGKRLWPIHEAKAEFTALIQAAEEEGPQIITRHGRPVAAVLSEAEFSRLHPRPRQGTLSAFFASVGGVLEVPERDRTDVTREIEL